MTTDGSAGEPLNIVEDATFATAMSLGQRVGKVPGPDGIPCEVLRLAGGKTVACVTAALNRWCGDVSADPLPICWVESRPAVIAKAPDRRKAAEVRPLGLVHTFQK